MGIEIFQRFFEQIVDLCQEAGLVWGRELYFDATKVEANADSRLPRPALLPTRRKTHVGRPLRRRAGDQPTSTPPAAADLPAGIVRAADASRTPTDHAGGRAVPGGCWRSGGWIRTGPPHRRLPAHERLAGEPDRSRCHADAGLGRAPRLGYHDHYVVDGGKRRIILAALVTPADVMENVPMRDLLWRVCFRRKLWPHQVTGDTTYGTTENIVAVEDAGIRAYVPLPDFDAPHRLLRPGRVHLRRRAGRVPLSRRASRCRGTRAKHTEEVVVYRADAADLQRLPGQGASAPTQRPRPHRSSARFYADYLEKVRGYHATEAYKKAMRKRQVWVEPLFAEAKEWHGLRRLRLRGLVQRQHPGAADRGRAEPEALAGRDGWGRRHAPCGSLVALPGEPWRLSAVYRVMTDPAGDRAPVS